MVLRDRAKRAICAPGGFAERGTSLLMLLPGEIDITRHAPEPGCSSEVAQKYTRWLATHHYENFNVVSWLLPKALHQHFYNLYAYCRWADDLGDEEVLEVMRRQPARVLLRHFGR